MSSTFDTLCNTSRLRY